LSPSTGSKVPESVAMPDQDPQRNSPGMIPRIYAVIIVQQGGAVLATSSTSDARPLQSSER
jgi:hypothetical protein